MAKLPPGVTRTSMPLVLDDVLNISDPRLIRAVSASPDLGRPGEQELPLALTLFFAATKFRNASAPAQWAAPMVGGGARDAYEARIADTRARLARGFAAAEVACFDALVRDAAAGLGAREVGARCAKLVAPLVLPLAEEQLPDAVAYASVDTLTDVSAMLNPFAYLGARRARRLAEEYVREIMPDAEYPMDYVHNLGAAAQGLGQAVVRMARASGGSEARLAELAADPVIPSVGRVVLRETTLGGLLPEDKPLMPGKALVTFEISEAFTATKDTSFMFGTGTETRQCPFKDLFLGTVKGMDSRE